MSDLLPSRFATLVATLAVLNAEPKLPTESALYIYDAARTPNTRSTVQLSVVNGRWHYIGIRPDLFSPIGTLVPTLANMLNLLNTNSGFAKGWIGEYLASLHADKRVDVDGTRIFNVDLDFSADYYRIIILLGGTVLIHDEGLSEWRYFCQL